MKLDIRNSKLTAMDPISNFLNKLKVANNVGKETFLFPASRVVFAIAEALVKKGYISAVSKKGKKGRYIEVTLSYDGKEPKVSSVKRVSKLSKRVYRQAKEIRPIRSGFGTAFFSTPRGILSDMEARTAKVGGEVLFEIW